MQVIMNNNMKKRLDSGIDWYLVASGKVLNRNVLISFGASSYNRIGNLNTGAKTLVQWKGKLYTNKSAYRNEYATCNTRKYKKIEVKYKSGETVVFSDTVDFSMKPSYSRDVNQSYKLSFNSAPTFVLVGIGNDTSDFNAFENAEYVTYLQYPILVKTAYKNGTPYNRASVKGTTTGDVRVSLIPPLDWKPTVTGVTLDSFEIRFYDDADRLTAIVTGTIGDLNSTADVKMANPTLVDGSFVNISGMDDFLIKMPNTLELTV